MKIYIAGKIREGHEREQLEKIDSLCKSLGHETFLPHRDAGLCKSIDDVKEIFNKDISEGMQSIDLVIALLEGLHIGAGTAWELGYAYANKIPSVGLKTDELPENALEELSAIILASTQIVTSFEELKNHLIKLKK